MVLTLKWDSGNAALNLLGRLYTSRIKKKRNTATVIMVVTKVAKSARMVVAKA